MDVPVSAARDARQQQAHDQAVELIAKTRYQFAGMTTHTNPGGLKNKSAGIAGGQEQYPDIVAIEDSTRKPSTIAEVETDESVDEQESKQWSDYGSLGLTFYLWVPASKVNDTVRIIEARGIRSKIDGLRGYSIKDGSLYTVEVWNAE